MQLKSSVCVAVHGFVGYYDDSYYETEKVFIERAMKGEMADRCLLISEGDVLGVLLPFCRELTVIIMNKNACE